MTARKLWPVMDLNEGSEKKKKSTAAHSGVKLRRREQAISSSAFWNYIDVYYIDVCVCVCVCVYVGVREGNQVGSWSIRPGDI